MRILDGKEGCQFCMNCTGAKSPEKAPRQEREREKGHDRTRKEMGKKGGGKINGGMGEGKKR
jgi:hypothetical protein